MAKQLNQIVNLSFTADTSKAKMQLQDLQNQLTKLINNPTSADSFGFTKEIQEASVAAATLKAQLKEATNVNTGKLDLGKFNQSLQQSGYRISDYKDALLTLGPEGSQAFATLAQSITMAEVPLKRSSALLTEFATTLKNTARWQISSSILHGFMGSLQSAYGYAQNLNESLTNIRIVTGESADQMAAFAKQANESAKALSTTTTAYTDAALIFYQQGLSGSAVTERTDAVIKMSNVTGESAEAVSSYMTAIWNNFADGSESLEHYADVITELGAATASSSEEIAEGLQKFASVGETVGLSYDYATTALATVVAETRQSADVVGTAFKTLFARIQDLELGNTLEDGTTLGTYSQALEAIGVNIKDASGEVKKMDAILDEMGAKWQSLSKDEQIALAQAVAGTRQYTQLIALMDKWDVFKTNLSYAQNADGSLQKQADIYAESWEAAEKRVKASAQAIYDELLNDDFFIGLNNVFASLLDTINSTIDGLGGLKGVLLAVASILLSTYKEDAVQALQAVQYRFMMMTETGRKKMQDLRTDANKNLKNLFVDDASVSGNLMGEAYTSQASVQNELLEKAKGMTAEQQKIAQLLLDQHTTLVQNVAEQKRIVEEAEDELNLQKLKANLPTAKVGIQKDTMANFAKVTKQASTFETTISEAFGKFDTAKMAEGTKSAQQQITQLKQQIIALETSFKESEEMAEAFGEKGQKAFTEFAAAVGRAGNDPQKLEIALNDLFSATDEVTTSAQAFGNSLRETAGDNEVATSAINKVEKAAESAGKELGSMVTGMVKVETSAENFGDRIKGIPTNSERALEGIIQMGQALSTFAMSISSITSLINTWEEVSKGNVEANEAVIQTFTTLGFVIPMLISAYKALTAEETVETLAKLGTKAAERAFDAATRSATMSIWQQVAANIALEASVAPVLTAILLVTASLTVLIASIYLIVKAVKAIEAAKPEGVLKSAKEAAQEAATAAQECATAYSNVKSALDELESSISAIDDLERGTVEWKEAILESNDALIDLLSTYDMLSSENFTTNADGLMELTSDAKEALLNKANAKSIAASSANYAAQIRVNNAENRTKASEAAEDLIVWRGEGEGGYDAASSNSQVSADIGMAIAEAMSSGVLSDDDLVQGSDKLVKALDENAGVTAEEAKSIAKQIADNDDLIKGMSELAVEVANNTEANRILNNQIVESNFGEKIDASGLSEENQTNLENLMGAKLDDLAEQLYNSTYKDKFGGLSDAKIQEQYAEAMGYSTNTIENKSGNKAKYYNEDGSEVGVISDETARRYLAQQEAIKQMSGNVQGYIDTVSHLIKLGDQIASGVGDAMASFVGGSGGNLSGLTQEEEQEFANKVSDYDSISDTFNIGDTAINKEITQALGYETVQEYYNSVQSAIEAYEDDYANVGADTLSEAAKKAFESIDKRSDISLAGQEALAGIVEDAFIATGRSGAQTVADLIEDNVADIDGFSQELENIDWDTVSLKDLKDTMRNAGIETNLTDEQWQQLIAAMKSGNGIIADATTQYKALHNVIDDLSAGSTISEEDYQALGGDIYESFFLKMADGTYKLTTDAQTFYDVVNQKSIENFKSNIDQITNLKNSGYDIDILSKSAMTGRANDEGIQTYNGDQVLAQLNYLESTGYSDAKQLAEWQDAITNNSDVTIDMINQIGEAVSSTSSEWANLDGILEDNQEQLASTAINLNELHEMLNNNEISVEAFTKAAMAMDAVEDLDGLDADGLKDYADYLQEAASGMDNFNESMTDNEAQVVAKGIMKMNDAIDTLADKFVDSGEDADSWASILKKSSKSSEEYAEAMIGTKNAVADLLDISSEYVSSDFIVEHLDEIGQAATGDAEAIDSLKEELSESVVDVLSTQLAASSTEADRLRIEMQGLIDQLGQFDNLEVGASVYIDGEDGFVNALNALILETGMTVDQINALCDSMGFEANFAQESQPIETKIPEYTTYHQPVVNGTYTLDNGDGSQRTVPVWSETSWTEQTGEHIAVGEAAAFSMTTDGSVPKINSITKKASGSSNNYSLSNTGGKSKSSGSSSGGGSSSKSSKKDYEDYNDDEAELYHEIKEAIKDVEHEMTKLEKTQSHLYGGALISSLKQQNVLLSQQRANYEELNREIEERQSALRGLLSQYGDAEDYYGTFNNIQASYNSAVDNYNALIDSYNAMSKEQQEANDDAIEAAKDELEARKDAMNKAQDYLKEYYDNKEELRSNDEKQQELLYEQIENNLKAYETEIELKLDTTEAERSLSEFLKKIQTDIKNLYKTSAEWVAEFENDQFNANSHTTDAQTHMDQLSYYKQIYNNKQWGGENDLFASESEAINAIVEAEKQLLEDGNTLLEDYEDAYSDLKDAFSEVVDQFDDIIDNFDRIDDTLDHYQKINELLYGESTSGRQNAAASYQVAIENSIAKQNALNNYIKALQQKRIDALSKGYDEDDDYIKNIDNEINDKTSELESAIESYINTIQSQLENAIQMAKEVMDKSIWGGSLTDVQQEWDDKKAMAEGYYDEVEKIYELESLESKWQSAINSASSIKAQQQLKSLMEAQVESLKNKTALSEKDVELAEKEIAVYQAQIALEEAQNAKNSMKLIRDESGNWSYQYIADEDEVADKQQDYLDKLNEWRTFAVDSTEEIKEKILEAYTNFSKRMAEIASDTTLSDEERAAKIAELTETYYGEDGIITKAVEDSNYIQSVSNQATFQELWELYQNDQTAYEQMTENEKALIDSLRDQGIEDYSSLKDFIIGSDKKSGAYGDILDTAKEVNKESSLAWDSMAADAIEKMYGKDGKLDKSSVTGIVQQAYKDMQTALEQYDKAIETSEKASGTEWSKVGIQLVGTDGKGGVKGQIDSVTNSIQGVIDKIGLLNDFESEVLEIESAWYAVGASIQSATSDLYAYLSLLNGGGSGSSGSSSSGGSGGSSSGSKSGSGNGSVSGNAMGDSSSGGDGKLSVGDTATYSGKYYYTSQGASPTGSKYSGVTNGVVVDMVNDSYGDYSYHIHSADGTYSDLGWVKKSQLSGYDTGGYTGSWDGGEGRLALLHSKELVLNADDTSNFLTAVSSIREIANLGNISSTIASGVASLVRSMLGFSNNNLSEAFSSNNSTTEGDTFNISAEFPNANNAEEIREAIMSLPTLASQYLSRNSL